MNSRPCAYSSGDSCCNYMNFGKMYLGKMGQINPVDTLTPAFPLAVPSLRQMGLMPPTAPPPTSSTKIPCSSVYCKQF